MSSLTNNKSHQGWVTFSLDIPLLTWKRVAFDSGVPLSTKNTNSLYTESYFSFNQPNKTFAIKIK